jgi:hypothetical protein
MNSMRALLRFTTWPFLRVTTWLLFLVPFAWVLAVRPLKLAPLKALEKALDRHLVPLGVRAAALGLGLALPLVLAATLAACSSRRVLRFRWSEGACDLAALCAWLLLQLAWHITRLQRFGWPTFSAPISDLNHVSLTFALTVQPNLLLLLLPILRGSALTGVLAGIPSERLVRWHRFVGYATLASVLAHVALMIAKFVLIEADGGDSVLSQLLQNRWEQLGRPKDAVLPGSVATLALILLWLLSLDCVRRRCYEFFIRTHLALAALFLLGSVLHYDPLLWFALPGLVLYVADKASSFADSLASEVRLESGRDPTR